MMPRSATCGLIAVLSEVSLSNGAVLWNSLSAKLRSLYTHVAGYF